MDKFNKEKEQLEKSTINLGLFGGSILGILWTSAIFLSSSNKLFAIILVIVSFILLAVFKGYLPSFVKLLEKIDIERTWGVIILIATIIFLLYFLIKFLNII